MRTGDLVRVFLGSERIPYFAILCGTLEAFPNLRTVEIPGLGLRTLHVENIEKVDP